MSELKITNLLEWGRVHNCEIPDGISFKYEPSRGIYCVTNVDNLNQQTNIKFELPNELIIRDNLSKDIFGHSGTNWLKFLFARLKFDTQSTDEKIISLQNRFQYYIAALPTVVDSPLVWNSDELDLLEGTNLGSSITDKFETIFKEWQSLIETLIVGSEEYVLSKTEELLMISFDNYDHKDIYENIIQEIVNNNKIQWYSFGAYLWSHLIFTSRAFPERIINPDCEESSVMLLPIIDLLNHGNHVKVEWSTNSKGSFCYTNLEQNIPIGEELLNNYGAKSNEELLYGYGFTLDDNEFDSVMLRIQLPLDTINNILDKEPTLRLPLIDDYTTFAFETKTAKSSIHDTSRRISSDYKDGILFLLNKTNTKACLDPIIDLFGFLVSRTGGETFKSSRAQFDAIQSLKNALHQKSRNIVQVENNVNEPQEHTVSDYRRRCATIYKDGQIDVLKKSLQELKKIEKNMFSENKNSLLTTAKVLKYDESFSDEITKVFCQDETHRDINFDTNFEIFVLWLVCKVHFKSIPKRYGWVLDQFNSFKSNYGESDISEGAVELYTELFSEGEDSESRLIPFNTETKQITLQELSIAYDFIEYYSFARLSMSGDAPDTILVKV
ncbi:similar to Saccharomyces cerevisiae YPL208W RKM1 SET-domain lysine-N-methyltransferase [Maudiozyma saulgeensis]|uniref:Similar to Saccharomyces cerevisiae YPL208W RKM1 SET-domain lysine-N-methyltransferase n=1 Tax=Maudiozyma saulgeensis TaxID=1789683 RepID=A0A1X7R769_9SACH|nr:similar to Saccharomyces cerevisiae YPL208W RKM1 SET-domain lysine-N-methyltransferase [Kazachstania saulgeensis]